MPYLTQEDYTSVIKERDLLSAIESNHLLLVRAEDHAISKIKSYLGDLYDMAAAYATVGLSRNSLLVEITLNLALAHILRRVPSYRVMDGNPHIKAYEESLTLLERISEGKASIDLTRVSTDPADPSSPPMTRFGGSSQPSRSHRM